jgi:Undecaprenyl-phosphate galactose phosphotransferase WbaP
MSIKDTLRSSSQNLRASRLATAGNNAMLQFSRTRMTLITVIADLAGFILAWSAGVLAQGNYRPELFQFMAQEMLRPLIITMVIFRLGGLYPGNGIQPPEEMKRVCSGVMLGYLLSLFLLFIFRTDQTQLHAVLVLSWLASLVTVILSRWVVRIVASRLWLWGEPVAILGSEKRLPWMVTHFRQRNRLGLVPALAICSGTCRQDPIYQGIPVIGIDELNLQDPRLDNIKTLLVDATTVDFFKFSAGGHRLSRRFAHNIFISDQTWMTEVELVGHDYEGLIGLEAHNRSTLSYTQRLFKQALEFGTSLLLLLGSLPVSLLAALAIKLDSPGPVFFRQARVGKNGRTIQILKFRTMVTGAEQALEQYLQENPDARQEWLASHKLQNDPRVTRVGAFLRKTSLDELPQLWNVFRGEMSLVGPRPITAEEIHHYGEYIEAYKAVLPGITGLWQVSGRSETTYDERVRMDVYYARNWSIWLDFYILLRTPWVVLLRHGAY